MYFNGCLDSGYIFFMHSYILRIWIALYLFEGFSLYFTLFVYCIHSCNFYACINLPLFLPISLFWSLICSGVICWSIFIFISFVALWWNWVFFFPWFSVSLKWFWRRICWSTELVEWIQDWWEFIFSSDGDFWYSNLSTSWANTILISNCLEYLLW